MLFPLKVFPPDAGTMRAFCHSCGQLPGKKPWPLWVSGRSPGLYGQSGERFATFGQMGEPDKVPDRRNKMESLYICINFIL